MSLSLTPLAHVIRFHNATWSQKVEAVRLTIQFAIATGSLDGTMAKFDMLERTVFSVLSTNSHAESLSEMTPVVALRATSSSRES